MSTTIDAKKAKTKYLLFAMFFTGFSLFLYEVLLTRLFSAILSFNLVFLIASFAILGSGIGGIWTHKVLKQNRNKTSHDLLKDYGLWIPISIMLTIALMYFMPFIPVYTLYAFIGAVPFVLGGIVISSMFKESVESSHKLYLMDLVGSALGSLAFIQLMNKLGFMNSVIIVCITALLASILIYLYCNEKRRILISFTFIFALGLVLIQGDMVSGIEKNFKSYFSSPNTTMNYLKDSSEKPVGISFSKWDAISRTDVIETTNKEEKIIVTDGGASAPIVRFDGNIESIQNLKKEVNYIPFTFGNNDKTLVIGSGGGKDVLFALLGGSDEVHAVEINPSTVNAVNYYRDFSGNIYNRDGVETHIQDGRNFVDTSSEKYDNIYLSMVMTNSVENTMYSLSENYIFTTEAFKSYLDHLESDGKLSFMMHGSMDLLKIVNTGVKALLDRGVPQEEVTDYFVIVNGADAQHKDMHNDKVSMPLVIFKNEPFSEGEIQTIKAAVSNQMKDMIHYPGNENALYKLLKDNQVDYNGLVDKIVFNSKPITDNSPFFYNYSKFLPREILYVFIGTLIICMALRRKYVKSKEHNNAFKYFTGLGIAYMLVEIPIIQKMNLYFGNPSMAFSIILFSILLSSGIGSGLSGTRFVKKFTDSSPVYLLAVAISILVVQFNLGRVMALTNQFSFNMKIIVGLITIAPMGILMGIPFATGLSKLKTISSKDDIIPLMWGVNGLFSVLGSVTAVIISMKLGFNAAIYAGASIYLILFVLNPLKQQHNVNG